MELRPPRVLAGAMAAAAVLCAGLAAWATTGGWVGIAVAVALGGVAVGAGALAVIMARQVLVEVGQVVVSGPGGTTFALDDLRGPLEVGLFGVRLDDGRRARRVLAQLPTLATRLVAELPGFAPQLRPPVAYPIVARGRISTPVAYGVVAVIGTVMGAVGLAQGTGVVPRLLGGVFAVGGIAVLYWVLRRVERRVEITADAVIRRHLLGSTSVPRGELVAAHVVTRPRSLPRSTLERDVHLLRLVEADGRTIDVAPAITAFPDYGSDGERALARSRAFALARLADQPVTWSEVHEGGGAELALWHHQERSAGALPSAVVFRRPLAGRHAVGLLEGDVAVGDHPPQVLIRHGGQTLLVIDVVADRIRRFTLDGYIRELDPGFGRIRLATAAGVHGVALHGLEERPGVEHRPGWPPGGPVLPATPPMPWMDALVAVLAAAPLDDDPTWALLAARCWPAFRRLHATAPWIEHLDELTRSLEQHDG